MLFRSSMAKAKRRPAVVISAASAPVASVTVGGGDLSALTAKVAKLQAEVDGLKKQQAQILAFIKAKLK